MAEALVLYQRIEMNMTKGSVANWRFLEIGLKSVVRRGNQKFAGLQKKQQAGEQENNDQPD